MDLSAARAMRPKIMIVLFSNRNDYNGDSPPAGVGVVGVMNSAKLLDVDKVSMRDGSEFCSSEVTMIAECRRVRG